MENALLGHAQPGSRADGSALQLQAGEYSTTQPPTQGASRDRVQGLAVPKARFRIDTRSPRNLPPRLKHEVEAPVSTGQASLQANPCAGSRDGSATLADCAVMSSRGHLRPAIVIDASQTQESGGYAKAPHPWLVVHTSGRVCSVSTHKWPSKPGQLPLPRAPLTIVATEWEAEWEAKQVGAHFFIHSATGHKQWKAPPHEPSSLGMHEKRRCHGNGLPLEQQGESPRVRPASEDVGISSDGSNQGNQNPLRNVLARKVGRAKERSRVCSAWSDD